MICIDILYKIINNIIYIIAFQLPRCINAFITRLLIFYCCLIKQD